MGAIRLVTAATARYRWRPWLALCLLVILASGLVLAAIDAGNRTATAFPRFEAAHGFDAALFSAGPLPQLPRLPGVASATPAVSLANGVPVCACARSFNSNADFSVLELSPGNLAHVLKLVGGRLPNEDDPGQVLASYTLERDFGVHVGTVIRVPFAARYQRGAILANPSVKLAGPTLSFRVVGISAAEIEFNTAGTPSYDLYGTQALEKRLANETVSFDLYFVKLRRGVAGLPQFESQARALGVAEYVTDEDSYAATVSSSIHPQAVGWWALAVLSALVGLIVVGQALGRQAVIEAGSYGALNALGASRGQLFALGIVRTVLVALPGAAGGLLLAFLLTPFTPVGEARLADPHSGFTFDAPVFLLGGLSAVAVVLALGIWPAFKACRSRRASTAMVLTAPSRLVSVLSGAGAPPSSVIGVRHALERGRGTSSVPVASAMLGAVMAVTALCATAVFSSSLAHLTSSPALYGQPFDVWFGVSVGTPGSLAKNGAMLTSFERGRAISQITLGIAGDVSIDGTVVNALAGSSVRGPLLITAVSGRVPVTGDEVALGTSTLRGLGAHIGSVVTAALPTTSGGTRAEKFHVVGSAVFPPDFGTGRLGAGAVFTLQGLIGNTCPPEPGQVSCYLRALMSAPEGGSVLVRAANNPAATAYLARLEQTYSSKVNYPVPPTDLVNFGQAINFPLIFGFVLVVFGVATLLHLLVASVSRRRREVGLLKAIGFARSQVAFAVVWQTDTIALVGIVVGAPVGIGVGRAIWQAFASNLGVTPVAEISAAWLVALAIGTLVAANLLAVGPAIVASRLRPANLLKAE